MGSVSGGGGADRTRYSEDNWQNTLENMISKSQSNRTGSRKANFDSPQGQETLGFLSDQTQQGGGYQKQAGDAYSSLATLRSGENPNVEKIIETSNNEGRNQLAAGLAKSRAGNFRGGTGANLYSQDKVSADFANNMENSNANLRYGAFNDSQNRDLTANTAGAAGLSGLSGNAQQIATQLLAMLRGEDVADKADTATQATNKTDTSGGKSGTKSGTNAWIQGTYNYT